MRIGVALSLVFLVTVGTGVPAEAAEPLERGPSGLPLPRFVSLGSSKVNVRVGPSREYPVKWTFVKRGLPVEVVREYDNWRRVRDVDGEEGWVHHSLLSGKRTALVGPWVSERAVLHERADQEARVSAYLEPFVLTTVRGCDGRWCTVSGDGWSGHIEQTVLWGVYPAEVVD